MISIIMIVYKVEQYLAQAIESVLNQDYRDIELILAVSPSDTDNCAQICKNYAQKDSRIKLVECPPKGSADARNRGLEVVSGEYLGFVDADDYIEPDMYSSMLKNIESTGADMAVCGRFYEFQNKTLSDPDGEPKLYSTDEALAVTLSNNGFFLHCWDKLMSRKVFEGLHFRTDIYVEDRIVVDKLISKADFVVYDSTPKYHFRERSGSMSRVSGMVRNNVEANELMQDFLLENHPAITNECNRFMLYEYITAIQNELVAEDSNKKDIKEYQEKVKALMAKNNPLVAKLLKVKAMMAVYCPLILKIYTGRRQKNIGEELVRFP